MKLFQNIWYFMEKKEEAISSLLVFLFEHVSIIGVKIIIKWNIYKEK